MAEMEEIIAQSQTEFHQDTGAWEESRQHCAQHASAFTGRFRRPAAYRHQQPAGGSPQPDLSWHACTGYRV